MSRRSRRIFLAQATRASVAVWFATSLAVPQSTPKRWRAAIIGSTGKGDYGHGLDQAFAGLEPQVDVAGIADPDEAGRARAAARARAQRQYADYREMLDRERPNLVVVAP